MSLTCSLRNCRSYIDKLDMGPAHVLLSPLLAAPPATDEFLVSSLQPASLLRFDALTGVLERTCGPSPLTPAPGATILPGSSWHSQFVYRDFTSPGGSGFNVSSGLRAVFEL